MILFSAHDFFMRAFLLSGMGRMERAELGAAGLAALIVVACGHSITLFEEISHDCCEEACCG